MVRLTPAAASAVRELLESEGAPNHGLRLQIVGGGCEGLYYDLEVVPQPSTEDEVSESEGVRLFVDGRAAPLLDGTVVDYRGTFVFENPHAKRTCRCGASFR